MVRIKETEKSGSKEKKVKTGSKEENTKVVKGAKAKKPSGAKFVEASIPRASSKKDLKEPAATTSKTLNSVNLDSSLSLGQTVKKSKTKTDRDNSSKPSKDEGVTTPAGASSSKKRAREEPTMESNQAASVTKRKKLDQKTEKTVEKQSNRKKRVAKTPSVASDGSEGEDILEKEGQVGEKDEEIYLHGFSTDEDSSDEDEKIMEQDPLEVKNLPSKARDDAEVKRRLDAAKKKPVRVLLVITSLLTYSLRPLIEVCYTLAEYLTDSMRSR
jgi:nucleolar protein 15